MAKQSSYSTASKVFLYVLLSLVRYIIFILALIKTIEHLMILNL